MVYAPDPAWMPSDNGLLAASGDPAEFAATVLAVAGTVYLAKLPIRQSRIISNLLYSVTTAGNNTGGSGGTFAGIYLPAGGAPLALSADAAALLAAGTGTITIPMITPAPIAGVPFVWAAIICNLGLTQPTLQRAGAGSGSGNFGLAAASFRFATGGTGLSALPVLVPANNVASANALLVGAT